MATFIAFMVAAASFMARPENGSPERVPKKRSQEPPPHDRDGIPLPISYLFSFSPTFLQWDGRENGNSDNAGSGFPAGSAPARKITPAPVGKVVAGAGR